VKNGNLLGVKLALRGDRPTSRKSRLNGYYRPKLLWNERKGFEEKDWKKKLKKREGTGCILPYNTGHGENVPRGNPSVVAGEKGTEGQEGTIAKKKKR